MRKGVCLCRQGDPNCPHGDGPELACPECNEELAENQYHCDMCGWRLDLLAEAVDALSRCVAAVNEILAAPLIDLAAKASYSQSIADHAAADGRWDDFSVANLEAAKARVRMLRAESIRGAILRLQSARGAANNVLETIQAEHPKTKQEDKKPKRPPVRACAWCWLDLRDDEKKKRVHPLDCETHGICETCSRKLLEEERNKTAAN